MTLDDLDVHGARLIFKCVGVLNIVKQIITIFVKKSVKKTQLKESTTLSLVLSLESMRGNIRLEIEIEYPYFLFGLAYSETLISENYQNSKIAINNSITSLTSKEEMEFF